MSTRRDAAPIAIIGAACRFPGAPTLDAYWRLLSAGVDATSRVPADRWNVAALYDPTGTRPGTMYTDRGGFLERVDAFDAAFFGVPPREAVLLDPQQRLLLELSYEALEHAGEWQTELNESATGVFVGIGSNDYLRLLGDLKSREPYYGPGNANSVAAGRLSYVFGLAGPCLAVDTACSSALVALHLACQSVRDGECERALVGAVNLILTPETTIYFCRTNALARDGKCKTFDATADGYIRAEGGGAVVLKRLDDALAAGDRVLAIIRGSAVNQDGRSNALTAPSARAQEAVIRAALANASIGIDDVDFVEAHGTGTALGDPIEMRALASVFSGRREPLLVGSVKTNLGHTEAAAGMAGLLKQVLALQHGVVPPQLNFTTPSDAIDWTAAPIEVPTQAHALARRERAWRAGLSAFGVSGTNAHVILEQAPPAESVVMSRPALHVLSLSARTPAALRERADATVPLLDDTTLPQLTYTANLRRTQHEQRAVLVGENAEELCAQLNALSNGREAPGLNLGRARSGGARVAFVFPGQGGQWPGMARELLSDEPAFAAAVDDCAAALAPLLGWSVGSALESGAFEHDVARVQPVLFTYQVALAALWREWGVQPDAIVGHSVGEVAAAHVAGALTLDDAARVIAARTQLLAERAGTGAMLLVELTAAAATEWLGAHHVSDVSVAVENSRRNCVLAGRVAVIEQVLASLETEGVYARRVKVDVAAHSPAVRDLGPRLQQALAGIAPRRAQVPLWSSVSGTRVRDERLDAAYWAANLTQRVRFADAIEALITERFDTFVEVNPHPTLLPAIDDAARVAQREVVLVASQRREESSRRVWYEALGLLHCAGATIGWEKLHPDRLPLFDLPLYPWQRERFWFTDAAGSQPAAPASAIGDYYDAGAQYHLEHTRGAHAGAHEAVLRGYLTWGLFPRIEAGFSWLRTVALPHTVPQAHELLERAQQNLRSLLFRGIEFERVTRVLDFGCGYGTDLIALAQQYPGLHADGLTISPVQAEIGETRATELGLRDRVSIRCADSATATLAGTYDVALGLEVAGLIEAKQSLFANIAGHLQPGGRLLLADFAVTGKSSFELAELSTYSLSDQGWAELLARNGFALLDVIDASAEVANCLYEEDAEVTLAELRAQTELPAELHEHLRSYANTERALRRGLMRYLLLDAAYDPLAATAELTRRNLARLSNATPAGTALDSLPAAIVTAGWLMRLEWDVANPVTRSKDDAGEWLVLGDNDVARALALELRSRGARVQESAAPSELSTQPRGLVDCTAAAECALLEPTLSALRLVQSLARQPARRPPRLWFVTRGTQVDEVAAPTMAAAGGAVWGLARTIAHEHPTLRCSAIDLPLNAANDCIGALADELLADGAETQVALRAACRRVARLRRAAINESCVAIQPDGAYLVTGGLGGLGLTVARWLAEQGARHIVLVGRSAPNHSAITAIEEIRTRGVRVDVVHADIADAAATTALFQSIAASGAQLRGVIHAAGVLDDRVLLHTDEAALRRLFAGKVQGALNLHEHTKAYALDFFILFSGVAALLGSPGQGGYAAANAALDALAQARRAAGLPAVAIAWGPWQSVGLVEKQTAALASRGVHSITPQLGLEVLARVANGADPHIAVLRLDARQWRETYPQLVGMPVFADVLPATAPVANNAAERTDTSFRLRWLSAVGFQRQRLLETHLQEHIAAVLRLDVARIDADTALRDLGFDSLMALELRNRLERSLDVALPVTMVWNYPTIDHLADYLAQQLGAAPEPAVATTTHSGDVAADLLASIEALSEEEAARLLEQEIVHGD